MNDLPPGWVTAQLGELISADGMFVDGDWVESKDQDPHGAVRLTQLADIGEGLFRDRSNRFLTLDKARKLRCSFLEPGDVLIARMPDPLGRACLYPGSSQPAVTAVDVCIIRPGSNGVNPRWLMWIINSPQVREQIKQYESGTTRKRISRRHLALIRISVPPMAEQDRIVAALEEHLSRLDAAVVSTVEAARRAAGLRRRTLANLVAPGSSGSWKKYRLENVATSVRNGMFVSRPGHEPDGVPILRISAVRSLALDLSDLRYSAKSPEVVQREGYLLQGGDLLFTRYNGNPEYVGACAVVPEDVGPLTYPDKLIRVSPDRSLVDPAYLAMACSAGGSRQAIRSAVKTTAGQAGISGGEIKRILLYLPDLYEQRRRAADFQEHDEAVRHVEENVKSVARRGDYLRRSLLTEAFAGRLVPQDPTEEPAPVLLERIRAEQAAQLRPRRRPKTATHAPQEETLL